MLEIQEKLLWTVVGVHEVEAHYVREKQPRQKVIDSGVSKCPEVKMSIECKKCPVNQSVRYVQ